MRRPVLHVLIAGMAFTLVAADALRAQDEGGRGGRGGRGGQFGGFGGMMGRVDRNLLLGSEQVRKELKLNEEQSKKVEEILASHREAQMEFFQGGRGNRDASDEERAKAREERTAKVAELGKKTDAKIAEVIDKKQAERLDQIVIQQQGVDALVSDKVIAAVSLKPEQVEKIKSALAKRDEELAGLRGQGGRRRGQGGEGGGGGNFEEARAKMDKIRKDSETTVLAMLTKEQAESYTKLKGEPFELDRSTLRGPGGRGGFGGQGGPPGGGRGGRGGEGAKKRPDADDEI